jgi:phosphotriesterase-related protein
LIEEGPPVAIVRTVLGDVDSADSGRIMPHEHLQSLLTGPWLSGGPFGRPDEVEIAVRSLRRLPELGFGTVVDLSPYGVVGRDDHGASVAALAEVARASGLHIVVGSATYLEPFAPAWAVAMDLGQLHRRFVADAEVGIGETGIRAGVLGEQATGLGVISPFEERALRAAARAAVDTGLALCTHTTHGTMALEQLGLIVAEVGTDALARVLVGHMDIQTELEYQLRVLDAGASIAFDTIGKQFWDFVTEPEPERPVEGPRSKLAYFRADDSRADRIAELVARGYGRQVVLAQDLTGAEIPLNPTTHGRWGYGYLAEVFVPMLRDRGVDDAAIERMLTENPRRLLELA